jgi:Tol biopolymer transport system component
MGEVYRARDTRLDREVAVKVLPELFADDPERLARFEREAKTLASLNHPGIAHVHGLEEAPPSGAVRTRVRALVMELVEGEDLSQRIARGPIPVREAMAIARQIADALEAAHEHGVVHRDLKPANVKIKDDGSVKVLDFGLAKAFGEPQAASHPGIDPALSPTVASPMTQVGVILGTAAYMAPEQARGKIVDRRADVWAFGCVLYEMLTGTRAFPGDEITDVLARVIERDADWRAVPQDTPPAVRQLLTRCLTKDPKQRLRDIGEARVALDASIVGTHAGAAPEASAAVIRPRAGIRGALPWGLAALLALTTLAAMLRSGADSALPALSASIMLPPDVEFFARGALSADGTVAAFVGVRAGIRQVWVRRLSDFTMSALRGSETASTACLSPDGAAVAFITSDGRLIRLSIVGGVSQMLATADLTGSLVWRLDDTIVFAQQGRLVSIPSAGGDPTPLTTLDTQRESSQRFPVASTDGAVVLFNSFGAQGSPDIRLEAVVLRDGSRHTLLSDGSQPIWASSDRLIFARDNALFATGFATNPPRLTGSASRVLENVALTPVGGWAAAVSDTGTLLVGGNEVSLGRLVWVTEAGIERPLGGPARSYGNPRLSPDGRMVLFSDNDGLWTLDVEREAVARIAAGTAGYPAWLPDSRRVVFRGLGGLQIGRADGEGSVESVAATSALDFPASASPDGSTLALVRLSSDTSGDIYLLPLAPPGAPRPLLATRAYEGGAQFSPDGKWIAYTSDDSGRAEVYLRPFPGPDRRWPVSTAGGLHPMWSPDGRRVFYRNEQEMLAVDVEFSPQVRLSAPRRLFDRRYAFGPNLSIPNYSISRSREFVLVKEEPGARSLGLVVNWLQTLAQ